MPEWPGSSGPSSGPSPRRIVPESVWRALTTGKGLRKGHCNAREGKKVKPVLVAVVDATLPKLTPTLQGVVRLLLTSGTRSAEVLKIRLADIDREGRVWIYRPSTHKTEHHDKELAVALKPKAQEIIRDFIRVRCPC